MSRSPLGPVAAFLFLVVSAGCHGGTEPRIDDPARAAGIYVLESVSGRGPVTGVFVLTEGAEAARRVRYPTSQVPGGAEYVAVGSFELKPDGGIQFALREDSGRSQYVWRVNGRRTAQRLTIEYPDPADGPNIVETYRRF